MRTELELRKAEQGCLEKVVDLAINEVAAMFPDHMESRLRVYEKMAENLLAVVRLMRPEEFIPNTVNIELLPPEQVEDE